MKMLFLSPDERDLIQSAKPVLWLNPFYQDGASAPEKPDITELYAAEARLARFAPLLQLLFPELEASNGMIESPLLRADSLNRKVNPLGGSLYLKADHELPVAGSIKARGGVHEVLCFAEALALEHRKIEGDTSDYRTLSSVSARELFSQYSITVGSTGNLGLSIGIIGAALGFKTVVHMSSDAKAWKIERLRKRGVKVIVHEADYGAAVAAGRAQARSDPYTYFVDDERSPDLFMGYAVAALHLQKQLISEGIKVDDDHPLFVYLPAGVGGAPGGITYSLKMLFGNNVHCFFAEPVQAPCVLIGMAGEAKSVPATIYDLGLEIGTDADGLAVGAASQWVCDATRDLLSGVYTATDAQLFQQLYLLNTQENIKVEPSAAIACLGPAMLNTAAGQKYLNSQRAIRWMENSTHIAWLTGGSFVPEKEYQRYFEQALGNLRCIP